MAKRLVFFAMPDGYFPYGGRATSLDLAPDALAQQFPDLAQQLKHSSIVDVTPVWTGRGGVDWFLQILVEDD